MGKYFGTDGVRGIAFEKLNESLAFRLGQGLSKAFNEKDVVVGYDTRQSSVVLAYMVSYGALSQGLNVHFSGVCSTPMLAKYAKEQSMIGIMITASHNPYTDNGIKVFNKGYKSNADEEAIIEEIIDHPITTIETFGHFQKTAEFTNDYLKLYDKFFDFKSSLNIVYDSANGGNYQIAKTVFDKFAQKAVQIGNLPNGLNINRGCGSTHMDYVQNMVKKQKADIGFSFDGDGDRLLICDQNRIYDGDEIIYLIARYLRNKGQLKDQHIVLTKMSNPGLLKALSDNDIMYTLTDVGDKYVTEVLHKNDYSIGGENSGHIIINSLLHTGDGLLAAIYVLYVLETTKQSLNDVISSYDKYPYRLENIKNVDKSILNKTETIKFLNRIKSALGDDALLLVRPSGTEPLVRVTVSHKDHKVVADTINKIVNYIHQRSE